MIYYLPYSHKPPPSSRCGHESRSGENGCNVPRLVGLVHEKRRYSDLCLQQIPKAERRQTVSDGKREDKWHTRKNGIMSMN